MLRRRDFRITTHRRAPRGRSSCGAGGCRSRSRCGRCACLVLVLPLLALLLTSLVPAVGVPLNAATRDARELRASCCSSTPPRAARSRNSFGLSRGRGAVIIVLIAVPLAYFLVWRRSRALARGRTSLTELPYALPGVVLAIAAILLFLKPLPLLGVSLYNTIWIILFCYLARFLVLGLRPIVSGYHQLDRTLEEAAQVAGARLLRRLRTIILPLVAPAAAAGALADLPHRLQRAHGVGAAVVVGHRDARRGVVLVPAGRRLRTMRPRSRTLTVVVSVALMLSTLLFARTAAARECCRGATDDRARHQDVRRVSRARRRLARRARTASSSRSSARRAAARRRCCGQIAGFDKLGRRAHR